jgi:hypothetical protein
LPQFIEYLYRKRFGRERPQAVMPAEQWARSAAGPEGGAGRPMLGNAPSEVVPVRLDPELREAVEARAEAEHTTTSEIIRVALRRFLDVA